MGTASSMPGSPRQSARWADCAERFAEAQRDQLPLWLPVMFGCGIAAWFVLPTAASWIAWIAANAAVCAAVLPGRGASRARQAAGMAALCLALGCALAWWRAESVRAPILARPVVTQFSALVLSVEQQVARERVRVMLRPRDTQMLPPKVRVTIDLDKVPQRLEPGDTVALRARLIGPPGALVPQGFDFRRTAWFQGMGAIGSALGPVRIVAKGQGSGNTWHAMLSAHVRTQIAGSAGGIAAAFASGDRGGISSGDEDAMRASGLTHLLSVSGLHITAVVGAAMLLTLKLLALSSRAALRLPLILIAAAMGAAAGIGYTLITGAEVPTIRSCVAAVLILVGIALGRQAFTLRLVATGAVIILMIWPEALIGPSFQLSFAAITAIVALHEWGPMRRLRASPDERYPARIICGLLSLLVTGVAVEIALAPIALFHFHRQGLYGALANIVAIPLTTFVTMPAEAMALLLDLAGLGAPFWWLTAQSLHLLLWIAHLVAGWPGAVAALATVPPGAFALIVGGGLWLALWSGSIRTFGIIPAAAGMIWALTMPAPDIIVTGDGVHLAVRGPDGTLATLRPRAGDYVRSVLAERSGETGDLADLDALPNSDCSADSCRIAIAAGHRQWRVLATRSRYLAPIAAMNADCALADIVVSDRVLPRGCKPRWLRADKALLAGTGGLAVTFATGRVETTHEGKDDHPWAVAAPRPMPRRPR